MPASRASAALAAFAILASAPLARAEGVQAALILADDGGLDVPAQKALRGLAIGELRKRGLSVSEDRIFAEVRAPDAAVLQALRAAGGSRLFALRVNGRLGQKVPLSLEELSADRPGSVYATQLTAASIEESDLVVPRLVDAVLDRGSAEDNAKMRTVTAAEARPFAKKPGERFWVVGLPLALYSGTGDATLAGFSLGYMYEAEKFRVGVTGQIAENKNLTAGLFSIDAAWIPLETELSPYLGAGVGYMGADDSGGVGGKLEGGIEAFRLHGLRLLAGVDVLFPFFSTHGSGASRVAYPALDVRLAF